MANYRCIPINVDLTSIQSQRYYHDETRYEQRKRKGAVSYVDTGETVTTLRIWTNAVGMKRFAARMKSCYAGRHSACPTPVGEGD